MKKIYLDSSATAPVYTEVVESMLPFFLNNYGNPSSPHSMGDAATKAISISRKVIANELECKSHEVIFTSGGTESNCLALKGFMQISNKKKLIISAIEHSSINEISDELVRKGHEVVKIRVDKEGFIDFKELENKIDEKTAMVSIIHGNNEIGTIQDIARIGKICKKKGCLFHTDAVQTFGKYKLPVKNIGIGMLSASAHKIGGPKGIGLLFVEEGIKLSPMIVGGQERGLRGGTENVPGIVGFSKALDMTKRQDWRKMQELRDFFILILEKLGCRITGSREQRLSDHVSVTFPGIDAELLVLALSQYGVYCSTKSACLNKEGKESKVLKAIGLSSAEIRGAVRFGLHASIKRQDLQRAAKIFEKCLSKQQAKR